ncbi:hypothetical protein BLNAU_8196 [Blattamonas nauphoetae]|uniref:Uncharacterized protein n=1 Tax=Blattamonas nauphoetae TaxID=2049346 RepID=A0ABQ9XZR0_9EUKA|nr:hypothetical protein BLNAU_8196 [Blattamonas nauphoetae]
MFGPTTQPPRFFPSCQFNHFRVRKWTWEKRMTQSTKANLYRNFKSDRPNSPIQIGLFRKVTKVIKRAKRRTDVCARCDRLCYIKKVKQEMIQRGKNIPEEQIQEEQTLELQRKHAKMQRGEIDNDIATCGLNEVVLLADFKENWKFLLRDIQVSKEFYSYQQISHLGCFIVSNTTGTVDHNFTHIFSSNLNHDGFFVVQALNNLLSAPPFTTAHKIPLTSLVFPGITFYLNYARDGIQIKASGLHAHEAGGWDNNDEKLKLKTRKLPEKEYPESIPHFKSRTGERTQKQIRNREEGSTPLKRPTSSLYERAKRRRSETSEDEVTQSEHRDIGDSGLRQHKKKECVDRRNT